MSRPGEIQKMVDRAYRLVAPNPEPSRHVRNPFCKDQRIWHKSSDGFVGSVQTCSKESYSNRHWAIVGNSNTVVFHWQLGTIYTTLPPMSQSAGPRFFVGQRLFHIPKVTSLIPPRMKQPTHLGTVKVVWGAHGQEIARLDSGETFTASEVRSGSVRIGQRVVLHCPD